MKYVVFLITIITACSAPVENQTKDKLPVVNTSYGPEFNAYWYAGKAEVASYNLTQARYGELHDGHAVLIFVTEPFSKSKQVKLDYPDRNPEDKVTVMKLNFTKKFNTGIYPYSMMLSAFSPVDQSPTMKVSMSSQEWCGQVWSQLNAKDNAYKLESYSYFESEGDVKKEVSKTILEDEIWNRIRLDYENLPTGKFDMIPGLFATRLRHKELKSISVSATLEKIENDMVYEITFPDERKLSIRFSEAFPHQILGWEETSVGIGGKELTTKATLDETLWIDYWTRNKPSDEVLRDSLGLEY